MTYNLQKIGPLEIGESYHQQLFPSEEDDDDEYGDYSSQASSSLKHSSSLQQILASISEVRSKDLCSPITSCHPDDNCLFYDRNIFWTRIFRRYFIDMPSDPDKDDMLFFIRKSDNKVQKQTELEVYRKNSPNMPSFVDESIDWEETVYLNVILQQFDYFLTCAICSRTGNKDLQILKKFTQRVYASPSRRQMDGKGTSEEITYPNIFFTVDNFEEAFSDIIVRDSEMVCVELVARDRKGPFQGIIFLGSIRYDALKKVYDTRASLSSRMSQHWTMSWLNNQKRIEFVRMRGPQGKGHAEMAVSRVKGSGPETPAATPDRENFPEEDFCSNENHLRHRRMSDPNLNWGSYLRFRRSGIRKSRSETENVDTIGAGGCAEVDAGTFEDEFNDDQVEYNGFFGKSFGQSWGWFKEKKRATSVHLHAFLTYVTLPWYHIIADVCEENSPLVKSVLTQDYELDYL